MTCLPTAILRLSIALASICEAAKGVATKAADVSGLRYAAPADGMRFDLTGQILTDGDIFQLIEDESGAAFITVSPLSNANRPKCGDIVRVCGRFHHDDYGQNDPRAEEVAILGRDALPCATPVKASELDRNLYRHLTVSGVVVSVRSDELDRRFNWILLKTTDGALQVAAPNARIPIGKLKDALDADVSFTGFSVPHASWRRNLGSFLLLNSPEDMRVIAPAPKDPFSAPQLTGIHFLHRQSAVGTIVAATSEQFYLSYGKGHYLPIRPATGVQIPAPGTRVRVAGFAETDPFNLQIVNALVRVEGGDADILAPARPIKPEHLFSNGRGLPTDPSGHGDVDVSLHGNILSVVGIVRYFPGAPENTGKVDLVCDGHTISIDVSKMATALETRFPSGSMVEISGLCLAEFESPPSPSHLPRFSRFTLVPRTPEDIKLIHRAPWWTSTRLKWLAISLIATIAGILMWTIALKRLAERRGRELSREQLQSAKAKVKVEERTRLAVELHDSISQTLTGIALQVDSAISSNAGQNSVVERFLLSSHNMLSSCRKELQSCLWDLRSRTFEEKDMTEAVIRTVRPYTRTIDLTVRFNVPRELLSETTTHVILKAVRELVVNAVRHGHARHVRIAGEFQNGTVRFSVRDDGDGFNLDTASGPADGHFGLQGIRERIRPLRGTIAIRSTPGLGTEATVTLDAIERNWNED